MTASKSEMSHLRKPKDARRNRRPLDGVRCRRRSTVGMHANHMLETGVCSALDQPVRWRSLVQGAGASPPSHTPADGTASLADGSSCYAHTINKCPTRPQPTATCVIMQPFRAAPRPVISFVLLLAAIHRAVVGFDQGTGRAGKAVARRVVTPSAIGATRVVADHFQTQSPRFTSPRRHSSAETALAVR